MNLLKNQVQINKYKSNQIFNQKNIDPITQSKIFNPVLDHDHISGHCRMVLDRDVNQYVGKIESNFNRFIKWKYPEVTLQNILFNIIKYLNDDYSSNPYHPNHLKKLLRGFNSQNKDDQFVTLWNLGLQQGIEGKTKKERLKQYKNILLNDI